MEIRKSQGVFKHETSRSLVANIIQQLNITGGLSFKVCFIFLVHLLIRMELS